MKSTPDIALEGEAVHLGQQAPLSAERRPAPDALFIFVRSLKFDLCQTTTNKWDVSQLNICFFWTL